MVVYGGGSACCDSTSESHPSEASGNASTVARYGLISRIGVPSTRSALPTIRLEPSIPMSGNEVMPIGFGRCGERVAKTPRRFAVPRGGRTRGFQEELRWNHHTSHIRLNEARSFNARSSLIPGMSSMIFLSSSEFFGWWGESNFVRILVRMYPIGVTESDGC